MSEALVITRAEYLSAPKKYLRLSAGETQIHITGKDGKTLIVLGTGPFTDEEKEQARQALARLEND